MGPKRKRFVAWRRRCPRLPGENLLNHVAYEGLFVGLGHALRDQYDDGVAFPVRSHRASAAAAASDLNSGCGFGSWLFGCLDFWWRFWPSYPALRVRSPRLR